MKKECAKARVVAVACILAVGTIVLPEGAFACSCAAYPEDPAQAISIAFSRADVVFLGEVSDKRTKRFRYPPMHEVTFDVLTVWKGLSSRNPAVVRTATSSISCGYDFRKPGRYLVFGYWDAKREILTTNMCELTRRESEAQRFIQELDKLGARSP